MVRTVDAAAELLARRKARSNLQDFIVYLNPEYIVSDFSRAVCSAVDEFIEDMMAGRRPVLILGAPPQHGKLIADYVPVLTTQGWKTHGDLSPGDMVFHPSGKAVRVVAETSKAPANVRVALTNGEVVHCHERHEWTVYGRDKKRTRTLETRHIDPSKQNMLPGVAGQHVRVSVKSIDIDNAGHVGKCIQVDSPDGLYLIGRSLQPTHNSDIVSRYLPAYFFGRFPDYRVAGLSYGKDLATDMNRDVQRVMMGEEYHNLFPDSCLNKKRVVTVEVEAKRNSETFEIIGHKGSYVSQGVGGPLTGKRVDLGIIDDPIKNATEALSPTTKQAVWNWYVSTFLTRLSKNSGHIVMATRWATDDLSGQIEKTNPRARVLKFPAINEDGEALVPDLHPVDKLLETKATMTDYFWSAMYQQSPVIMGGGIFKDEWWGYYVTPPAIQFRIIYADTAQKTKQQNDYSVLQCWGKTKQGQLVLLDMIRDKWESPELITHARAFYNKHKAVAGMGVLRAMKVEDKVSGTSLIQTLRREGIPVVPIPRTTDKITRAMDAAPLVASGNVLLPQNAPWLSDFLSEARAFPNATHDDTVDPMMDAVIDNLSGGSGMAGLTQW